MPWSNAPPVPPGASVAAEPVAVFEILSERSGHEDLVVKNAAYRASLSVMRYVVLEQTHAGALVFTRKADDWIAETVSGEEAVLAMPEIGIAIPLAELYQDLTLATVSVTEDQPA